MSVRERVRQQAPFLAPAVRPARRASRELKRLTWDQIYYRAIYKPDRKVLEDVIFPAVRSHPGITRVLFVGVEWYTKSYGPQFFPEQEYWTIDIDPDVARYGSPGRHVVDSVTEVGEHFEPEFFDAVICNGLFPLAINTPAACDRAFNGCFEILRPGGLFVHGWINLEDGRPFELESLESIRRFRPYALPPFPAARYPTFGHWGQTFDFYTRALREANSSISSP